MNRLLKITFLLTALLALASCMKWDYGEVEDLESSASGLFVACEGNFQYGNATLSYYDPASGKVQNEVFFRANGMTGRCGPVDDRVWRTRVDSGEQQSCGVCHRSHDI